MSVVSLLPPAAAITSEVPSALAFTCPMMFTLATTGSVLVQLNGTLFTTTRLVS